MSELWSSASYAPHLLSLLFAFAPAMMMIVIAYAVVMRGEPRLRGWLLAHTLSLLPYAATMMLSPSITSPAAAETLFRFGAAFIPMASATGAGFQVALVGKQDRYGKWIWLAIAAAAVWIVVGTFAATVVDGVRWIDPGFWYARAGGLAWAGLVTTFFITTPPFLMLAHAALFSPPSHLRRQWRYAFVANAVTYSGLVDAAFAYGHGIFPVGWLLSGFGSLLLVRAMIVEDLLRVRAVDTSAPALVLLFASGVILAWFALAQLGPTPPWWGTTLTLVSCFIGVRVTIAVVALVNRGPRNDSALDRLLAQLATRARPLGEPTEVAQLAIDVIELGLGVRTQILLAASDDWGWTTATGERLADELAPDPVLSNWLGEHRGALFFSELDAQVPADLREMIEQMFARHRARALVPVTSQDELLALVMFPAGAPRQGGRSLEFLERASDRLAEALAYAKMAERAARADELAREVELAATVQRELLPGREPTQLGDVAIVGSWQPATRCGGDFWGVYPLAGRRVLVAVGDVTGHGVASAMVTAAAAGACEVAARRAELDLRDLLAALDAAVARVSGGTLSMSCAAAILDPDAGEIRFVSAGHTAPYLCRSTTGAGGASDLQLQALVARGSLLGSGTARACKVVQRPLAPGDLVVWYTDGVTEAADPRGEAFGDRRLQRLLKKLDRAQLAPATVHDVIHAAVATHRAGGSRADDETLVVAQLSQFAAPADAAPAAPAAPGAAP